MQKTVTPWTATAQSELENTEPLFRINIAGYSFLVSNTGDSIWLTAQWPASGSIAFRLAFAFNSTFENVIVKKKENEVTLTASTDLGSYKILLKFPESEHCLFSYTTKFKASFPFLINSYPRDIVPLTKKGRVENTAGIIHTHQVGGRSGLIYFGMTKPKTGSVFYFQNLSALAPYCEACETSVADSVGGQWPEIGFQFPLNSEKPIPSGKEFTMSDAFVILSEQLPDKDNLLAVQFLDYLGEIYTMLPKPETKYRDWPEIAEKALHDLNTNKGCWTQTNGVPYLNAYVADYETPAEIMVQLAVLVPLHEYLKWKRESHEVYTDIKKGIPEFYDNEIKSIVRWLPALESDLDDSEEQKKEMVMDSWYLHHPLLNLARLALDGDKVAEDLFMNSIDYAMKVAKHFDYDWPVFYKMTTLEVLKSETSPGEGGENDVPGSYAHIMLMAYKLTRDKRYLREAERAAKRLDGLGFDIFYQANNTAFTAGALAELFLETGKKKYLELSYCCLASIFKNVQLWDCDYGNAKAFPSFFSVFPLNDAPYTAAYEELEVYAALHHYLFVTKDIEIPSSLRILLPEFIKYTVNRLLFYYPPVLPKEIISDEIKTGEVQRDLWIPLEDMRDGWEEHGQVGQEVYGAALPFGIVPRQYFLIKELGTVLFCDYPVVNIRNGKRYFTFTILGNQRFKAKLKIIRTEDSSSKKIKVEQKTVRTYKRVSADPGSDLEFTVNAGTKIRLMW